MKKIATYVQINCILLFKSKLSIFWSVGFPIVLLIFNKNNIKSEKELAFWWVYIVLCSFFYGVGIYSVQLREWGIMKTLFSINKNNWIYFLGNVITQILYSFFCLFLFDLFSSGLLHINLIVNLYYSIKVILYCLPIAFLSYNLNLFKKIQIETIQTMSNIIIFLMFILVGKIKVLDYINPLLLISKIIFSKNIIYNMLYLFLSLLLIIFSIPNINKFSCLSSERR